jgi:predicted GNAT superfamily acetyltransferase
VRIRALTRHSEFAEAVELQRAIWNFADIDVLPVRLFVVAANVGGQTLGAFEGRRMVGFLLAIPGVKPDGKAYLHSHMTGVLPEYQGAGVGRMLKMAQKEDALARGFRLIEWTFDPFNARNAYFNLEVLGAVVTGYVRNAYGTTTSPLHRGLPTDRCVAQWWIRQQHRRKPVPLHRLKACATGRNLFAQRFERLLRAGLAATGFERNPEGGEYLFAPWRAR